MHNKFVLIDDEAVLTGSLNWTREVRLYIAVISVRSSKLLLDFWLIFADLISP